MTGIRASSNCDNPLLSHSTASTSYSLATQDLWQTLVWLVELGGKSLADSMGHIGGPQASGQCCAPSVAYYVIDGCFIEHTPSAQAGAFRKIENSRLLHLHDRQMMADSRSPDYQREPKWRRIPPLTDVIDQLRQREYLPAIWFLFSRAGCDTLAKQAYAAGVRLTTDQEQAEISKLLEDLRCAPAAPHIHCPSPWPLLPLALPFPCHPPPPLPLALPFPLLSTLPSPPFPCPAHAYFPYPFLFVEP